MTVREGQSSEEQRREQENQAAANANRKAAKVSPDELRRHFGQISETEEVVDNSSAQASAAERAAAERAAAERAAAERAAAEEKARKQGEKNKPKNSTPDIASLSPETMSAGEFLDMLMKESGHYQSQEDINRQMQDQVAVEEANDIAAQMQAQTNDAVNELPYESEAIPRFEGDIEAATRQITDHRAAEAAEAAEKAKKDKKGKKGKKGKLKKKASVDDAVEEAIGSTSYSGYRKSDKSGTRILRGEYANASALPKNFEKYDTDNQVRTLQKTYASDRSRKAKKRVSAATDAGVASPESIDREAFASSLGSIMAEEYESSDEMYAGGPEEKNSLLSGRRKINKKIGRTIDKIMKAYELGWFPIYGEHVRIDSKKNTVTMHWSRPVEDHMNALIRIFKWDENYSRLDAQRNVFRLVMLYYALTIDTNGKIFNQDASEWKMTEDQFCDACEMIFHSCQLFGHPMAMPVLMGYGKKLGGTDIYPCCYLPEQLREMLMCPGSILVNPQTGMKTADDLNRVLMQEWQEKTHPTMEANLVKKNKVETRKPKRKGKEEKEEGKKTENDGPNLVAQRIMLETIVRSMARIDGMSTEDFGDAFDIDVAQHTRIIEYAGIINRFAESVPHENVDMQAVLKRQEEKHALAKEYWNRRDTPRTFNRGPLKGKEYGDNQIGAIEASINLCTAFMRVNALAHQISIMMSAIIEKGVGDLQTHITINASKRAFDNGEEFTVPQELMDAFKTQEAAETIDAALLLLQIGGPQALQLCAQETIAAGRSLDRNDAMKWLEDNVLRYASSKSAAAIRRINRQLSKASQRILVGDMAFKKKSSMNFLNGMLLANQVLLQTQREYANDGYSLPAITGDQFADAFTAVNGDVTRFITEAVCTPAGRDAIYMMRTNNIGSINPVSYQVSQALRSHGITDFAITAWLDTFAFYGINFLHAITPMSRTIDYLVCKGMEWRGNGLAADLVIGGEMGARDKELKITDDIGFYNGLRMCLYFDAITIGKWHCIVSLVALVLVAIGYDPPDDPQDRNNVSKWKVGGNIGLGPDVDGDGKGDGVEIQNAFWINDLTQLGLPGAYAFAALLNGHDISVAKELFYDSLMDQVDGNVVLDAIDGIKNLGEDIGMIAQAANDPNFEPDFHPSYALAGLGLTFLDKVTPGAPAYKSLEMNTFLRGPRARKHSSTTVFDKSSDWAISVGKTDYVDDDWERMMRKHSMSNYALALLLNRINAMSPDGGASKTGYLWWDMPYVTTNDPISLAMYDVFKMDYGNIPPNMTREQYRQQRAEDLLLIIDDWKDYYGGPEAAIAAGVYIPHDIREATTDVLYSEITAMKLDFDAKCASGWFQQNNENMYRYKDLMYDQISTYYDYINDWLKNDDVPSYIPEYEQLVSDWDPTYVLEDGSPASWFDRVFRQDKVETVWKLKGNHPDSLKPFTVVDYSSNDEVNRGFSGETNNYFFKKGVTDPEPILEMYGDLVIPVGKHKGKTVREVIAGGTYTGIYLHPDDLTIGQRAFVPKKTKLPEDILGLNEDTCSGGVYGDIHSVGDSGSKNLATGTQVGMVSSAQGNGGSIVDSQASKSAPTGTAKATSGIDAVSSAVDKIDQIFGTNFKTAANSKTNPSRFGKIDVDAAREILNNTSNSATTYYPRAVYSRRSSGGGGSGYSYEYNPKIYSNSPTLYSSKPSTMYSKTPSTMKTYNYLRPSFSTKGSREAYKRQDF